MICYVVWLIWLFSAWLIYLWNNVRLILSFSKLCVSVFYRFIEIIDIKNLVLFFLSGFIFFTLISLIIFIRIIFFIFFISHLYQCYKQFRDSSTYKYIEYVIKFIFYAIIKRYYHHIKCINKTCNHDAYNHKKIEDTYKINRKHFIEYF